MHGSNSPDTEGLSVRSLWQHASEGARFGAKVPGAMSWVFKAVFAIFLLLTGAFAGMATPLLRTRAGIYGSLLQVLPGAAMLGVLIGVCQGSSLAIVLRVWMGALGVMGLLMIGAALRRFFKPGLPHVATMSLGQPAAPWRWLWKPMLRRWSTDHVRVALFGEAPLLLLTAAALRVLDVGLVLGHDALVVGVWVAPLLAAVGIIAQSIVVIVAGAAQLNSILDRAEEQRQLSEVMEKLMAAEERRSTEGFVALPRG